MTLIRTARFIRAYLTIVRDPLRLDQIFVLADNSEVRPEIRAMFEAHPEILAVAAAPMMAPLPELEALRQLPDGTVGREYARLMETHDLDASVLNRDQPDTEEGRVRTHLGLSHDLWHVLTGFGVDVEGELALQAFTATQAPFPLALATISAGLLHVLITRPTDGPQVLDAVSQGWRLGREATGIIGLDWHAWLDRPLDDLRQEVGLAAA